MFKNSLYLKENFDVPQYAKISVLCVIAIKTLKNESVAIYHRHIRMS